MESGKNGAVMESKTTTIAVFSYFGADRVIVKRRFETFVLGFPSLTDLQSNQRLVSHSNQMDLYKNSVIPNHHAQISNNLLIRKIDSMGTIFMSF